ncbi:DUF6285 domain-containing protein [Pelagibius sp. 7325]|uniref:DUF6285 domain-containing protein n=1 Tax=Pelagibius sp. 7325 TaxID=3131994 RepID=UPI0030EB7677
MTAEKPRGGEPAAPRLLELARRELLETLLPQLQGDARYRARLIANAMKIAAREAEAGATVDGETRRLLREIAGRGEPGPESSSDAAVQALLVEAIRAGRLDGDTALFEVLSRQTERRRSLAG